MDFNYTRQQNDDFVRDSGDDNIPHNTLKMQKRGVSKAVVPAMMMLGNIKHEKKPENITASDFAMPHFIGECARIKDSGDTIELRRKVKFELNLSGVDPIDDVVAKKIYPNPQTSPGLERIMYGPLARTSNFIFDIARDPEMAEKNPCIAKVYQLLKEGFLPMYKSIKVEFVSKNSGNGDLEFLVGDVQMPKLDRLSYTGSFRTATRQGDRLLLSTEMAIEYLPESLLIAKGIMPFANDRRNRELESRSEMKDENMLIVGGAGSIGYAAMRHFMQEYNIIIADRTVPFIPAEMNGGFKSSNVISERFVSDIAAYAEKLHTDRILPKSDIDVILYATALGEVGFPASKATPEEIANAKKVSLNPLIALNEHFHPDMFVGFTAFTDGFTGYFDVYGAMEGAKQALEFYCNSSDNGILVRAGHVRSPSFYGIVDAARKINPDLDVLWGIQKLAAHERSLFDNNRVTTPEDVARATSLAIDNRFPYVEVVGERLSDKLKDCF